MGVDCEARRKAEELEARVAQPQLLVQLRRHARPRQPGRRRACLRARNHVPDGLDSRVEVGLLELELLELEFVELEQLVVELLELERCGRLELVELE